MLKFTIEIEEDDFATWAASLLAEGYIDVGTTNEKCLEMALGVSDLSVVKVTQEKGE